MTIGFDYINSYERDLRSLISSITYYKLGREIDLQEQLSVLGPILGHLDRALQAIRKVKHGE